MEWLMTLFGLKRKRSNSTGSDRFAKINERLERLERQELILTKLNAIETKLEHFKQEDINALRAEVDEINKQLKRSSEPKKWPIIKEFEEQFDRNVAAYACYGLMIVFAVALACYLHARNNHDTIEYMSYIFPIVAAIAAGLTVYHDDLKSTLFTLSLIFLMSGIEAFIVIDVESDDVIVGTNITLYVLLYIALATRGFNAFQRARAAKADHQQKLNKPASPTRIICFYGGLVIFFAALLCFSGSFYAHNRPCIRAKDYAAMKAACSGSIWPSPLETLTWPATLF